MYEFNNINDITNVAYRFRKNPVSVTPEKPRKKLISLICWCLMPNHYHFFLCPIENNGLPKYQKKIGVGFTNFFNIKYKRDGVLFQGKYKKVRVVNDIQALQLICYIHSNPLDLWKTNWKEKGLTNSEIKDALRFLEKKYRWSSHLDWLGIKNFPSLIDIDLMHRFFKSPEEYRKFFIDWLKYYEKNIESIQKIILEK